MDKKLFEDIIRTHKKATNELIKLESELIELIAKTESEELMNKFLDWQNQRLVCNNKLHSMLYDESCNAPNITYCKQAIHPDFNCEECKHFIK